MRGSSAAATWSGGSRSTVHDGGRASVDGETKAQASLFGCNTYSYIRSHGAEACLVRLADLGFREFELMVHPGHLWPAELSAEQRHRIRLFVETHGLRLVSLNMPNIDINIAAAAQEMRAYSLNLLTDTVRLAGDLGAGGLVIGPGKANPLFPAKAEELLGHFFTALDRLCPLADASGTALWVENIPFAFLPAIGELIEALESYGNGLVRIVYDVANAHFIGEDLALGLRQCREQLALVHLSDTGQQTYRHDPVGQGTVPFCKLPRALAEAGYRERPMLEIISHDPDGDVVASANKLADMGFAPSE